MKKRLSIIVAAILLAAGAGVFGLKYFKSADSVSYAAYLPEDTLATISLTNIKTLQATFSTSPLGRFLAKDTMTAILDELEAGPEAVAQYNNAYDDVAELMNNPAFLAVFGDDTAVGILQPDIEALEKTPEQEVQRSLVIFATTAASSALESFAKLVVSESVTAVQVDGRTLTKITIDEQNTMYGAADNGTVLLSYNPQSLVRCLNVKESEQSLAATGAFQSAEAFWLEGQPGTVFSRGFVHPASLQALMQHTQAAEVQAMAQYLNGITYLASITFAKGDTLYSDSKAGFNKEQLHEMVLAAIENQAAANSSLHLLKETSLIYDWSSALSPEMMLYSLQARDAQQMEQVDQILQQNLGVSLDELFQAIGPQYGVIVNEIVNAGFFPLPKVIVFTEVRDKQMAQTVFTRIRERLNQSGFAEEQQVDAGGQTISYWSLLPGEATQLAMMMTEDMLYFANGMAALKEIALQENDHDILSPAASATLGETLKMQVEAGGLGTLILYPSRLATELEGIAQWLFTTLSATQGVSASRLGQEVLTLMKGYEVIGVTSHLTDEYGVWQSTMKKHHQESGTQEK